MTPQRFKSIARPHWRAAWLLMAQAGPASVGAGRGDRRRAGAADHLVADGGQAQHHVHPRLVGQYGLDFMPDDADFSRGKYGFFAAQCNGLAYNPNTTYVLPVNSVGAQLPGRHLHVPRRRQPCPTSTPSPRRRRPSPPARLTVTINNNNANYSQRRRRHDLQQRQHANLMVGTVTAGTTTRSC